MTTDVETIIVGAGVVGLAIARALAMAGQEVIVTERHDLIGSETSSRNSEVIHAGIYYPKDSLRAHFCVDGKHQLYRFCEENGVDYARCEKLIVATNDEPLARLGKIKERPPATALMICSATAAQSHAALEPAVRCVGALLSPSTGIVDSHGFMVALEGHAESHGAQIALLSDITAITRQGDGSFALTIGESDIITARNVIISAGLHASNWRARSPIQQNYVPPETYYAVGQYYALSGPLPVFSATSIRCRTGRGSGCTQQSISATGASSAPISSGSPTSTTPSSRKSSRSSSTLSGLYYPDLDEDRLHPDYTGIRPKLYREGEPVPDFRIDTPAEHGLHGLVMLFGIESPGLTASLAIADHIAGLYERAKAAA